MSTAELTALGEFIYRELGIVITPAKKTMLEARLHRRLRTLGLTSYREYLDYLRSAKGLEVELPQMANCVTTNTTCFLREAQHFDFLVNTVLPQFLERHPGESFRLWSAGCSSGEEPYTLAMVLSEFQGRHPAFSFSLLATDVSTRVLEEARRAVYPMEDVECLPAAWKRKYLLRSKDRSRRLVRVAPEIRALVQFRRLNFMEDFGLREPMHTIFCRNVMIYFDRTTQGQLCARFCQALVPGGYLFIGHSESLAGHDLPLRQRAPAVYQRTDGEKQ
jgi:chemotaxis protein methyltransferase CheR